VAGAAGVRAGTPIDQEIACATHPAAARGQVCALAGLPRERREDRTHFASLLRGPIELPQRRDGTVWQVRRAALAGCGAVAAAAPAVVPDTGLGVDLGVDLGTAQEKSALTQAHLERAGLLEYRELGQLADDSRLDERRGTPPS
jgi:hypothetical protein